MLAAKDYYELFTLVRNSQNFSQLKTRVKQTSTGTYLKRLAGSYGDIAVLFYEDQYEEAGEQFVKSLMPKKFKKHSYISWD